MCLPRPISNAHEHILIQWTLSNWLDGAAMLTRHTSCSQGLHNQARRSYLTITNIYQTSPLCQALYCSRQCNCIVFRIFQGNSQNIQFGAWRGKQKDFESHWYRLNSLRCPLSPPNRVYLVNLACWLVRQLLYINPFTNHLPKTSLTFCFQNIEAKVLILGREIKPT